MLTLNKRTNYLLDIFVFSQFFLFKYTFVFKIRLPKTNNYLTSVSMFINKYFLDK